MKLLEMILDMRMCDRVEHELGGGTVGLQKGTRDPLLGCSH